MTKPAALATLCSALAFGACSSGESTAGPSSTGGTASTTTGDEGNATSSQGGASSTQGVTSSASGGATETATSGVSGNGGASVGGTGPAQQINLADTFSETEEGAIAGDAPFAFEFCGDPEDPTSLKEMGTIVRVRESLRYFVCIEDFGADSARLMQTNIPSDPVQGFVPYAALLTYEDEQNPNLERPEKGNLNYALLVKTC